MPGLRRRGARLATTLALTLALIPTVAPAALPVPADVRAADALAAPPRSSDRDRALGRWARRASLSELMYVLRRQGLGDVEAVLVSEALERTGSSRPDLRRRLSLRLAQADPRRARRILGDLGADALMTCVRPRASAFRIAALLPDQGSYQGYGREVRLGIEAALSLHNRRSSLPLALEPWSTGSDDPARAAAALDSAADLSAVAVGELLSVSTLALATGARLLRLPLISPTATDESIGEIGPTVFQVGPSGYERGQTLARAVLAGARRRVGVLTSGDDDQEQFALGFVETARALGSEPVWRDSYSAGNTDFGAAAKGIAAKRVEVLFWEGDPRDASLLLRRLARDRVAVQLCGGQALAPDLYHSSVRPLLEGVRYVADDWRLPPALGASLDTLLHAWGAAERKPLHERGFLIGNLLASVIEGRALCPEEITHSLATRLSREPHLRARQFLDWSADGVRLPVFTMSQGRAVADQ